MSLNENDFEGFFFAVWECAPFPWQRRLVASVLADERWPDVLDLPTGSGKTTAIDVALFCLAARPERFPRRIVLVVDRRTIVDQAYARARLLAEALGEAEASADTGPLGRVARALRALCGEAHRPGDPPIELALLRGGVPREDDWAHDPGRPVIAVSTVDQVGSRLLFRGYGVSPGMRPIHAGLLGADTLFLLDEVHLSTPFAETLRALGPRRLRGGLPDRWAVVSLSATPGAAEPEASRFTLDAADHAHPVLARRLATHKPTRCIEVSAKGEPEELEQAFAARVASEARALQAEAQDLLVVVNRVETARRVFAALSGDGWTPLDPMAPAMPALGVGLALVTGRMPGLLRDRIGAFLAERLASKRLRGDGAPLVVVATQCIEAGADYDFDGLVTECASLDALRQRAGRVDRAGARGTSPVRVLRRPLGKGLADPIYGDALAATWAWLRAQGEGADLGLAAAPPPVDAALRAPTLQAPALMPSHLDAWAQTSPAPAVEPEPAHFLHGVQTPMAEVQVAWRVELDADALAAAAHAPEATAEALASLPPAPGELVSLPRHVVVAWLSARAAPPVGGDLEGAPEPAEPEGAGRRRGAEPLAPVALRWAGLGDPRTGAVTAAQLRAGDVIVVPAAFGGLRAGTFDAENTDPVLDLSERAQVAAARPPRLRLCASVLRGLDVPLGAPTPAEDASGDDLPSPLRRARDWLRQPAAAEAIDRALGEGAAGRLREGGLVLVEPPGCAAHYLLVGRRAVGTTEGDEGSFTGRAIGLAAHLRGVGQRAAAFATAAGLDPERVRDLEIAGKIHDLGKADPRFQAVLNGGDPVKVALAAAEAAAPGAGELAGLLAKSGLSPAAAAARGRAVDRAGYPRGARHELLSVALAEAAPGLLGGAPDPELVLHLVASHHGRCRPFAPYVADPKPLEVAVRWGGVQSKASTDHGLEAVDGAVPARFWALVRRYGPHGLAWMEAMLRLADHRQSEAEQQQSDAAMEAR